MEAEANYLLWMACIAVVTLCAVVGTVIAYNSNEGTLGPVDPDQVPVWGRLILGLIGFVQGVACGAALCGFAWLFCLAWDAVVRYEEARVVGAGFVVALIMSLGIAVAIRAVLDARRRRGAE